ncbi:uncharacterized protein SOCE836_037270 [Sorangium cellulosum]|uniref:Uncharacterized protein n=1 Tax=Sorangium cellulosum TaxID=56 RepID=A0A4P2QNS5_SORCE|nr:uncharacterized protein SOCE836_037270 [Sorangium cellulosum]WCQ90973.1 hypothetical protein NQZ70_03688 [Sorangium sp. Soce836]
MVLFSLAWSSSTLAQEPSGLPACCQNFHRLATELKHQLLAACVANEVPEDRYTAAINAAVDRFVQRTEPFREIRRSGEECGSLDDRVYYLGRAGYRRVPGCVPGVVASQNMADIRREVTATDCQARSAVPPPQPAIHNHFYINEVDEPVDQDDCCCPLPPLIDLPSQEAREVVLGLGLLPQIPAATTIGTSALMAARPGAQPLLSAEVPVSIAPAGVALGGGVSVSPFRMAREAQLARRAAARAEVERHLREAIALAVHISVEDMVNNPPSGSGGDLRRATSDELASKIRGPDAQSLETYLFDRGMRGAGPGAAGGRAPVKAASGPDDGLIYEFARKLALKDGAIWGALEQRFAAELRRALAQRATSPGADAGAIAREVASKLDLNNARSPARTALVYELLKLSESVAALVPSHEELARPVASSAWLDGLNISLAVSQPSSRVDQILGARAKFAVAMTFDYAGDYKGNRDPAANTELGRCIRDAVAELQEAAQQARQDRGAGGDTSRALSGMLRSAEERCYRSHLPPASTAIGAGVSPGFYVDDVERIQYDATRLWLALDWQHDAVALTSAFELVHFREPQETSVRVFPQGTMRGTLALRPASVAVELGVGAARMAAGAADEASDVAPRAGLHVGGSGSILLPVGLSLSASVLGRWSFEDDATEARVITSIGWAEMPDFIRRALEYSGFSARR